VPASGRPDRFYPSVETTATHHSRYAHVPAPEFQQVPREYDGHKGGILSANGERIPVRRRKADSARQIPENFPDSPRTSRLCEKFHK
jgi:hypothetical protein